MNEFQSDKDYEVTMVVHGVFRATINAHSEDEARELATSKWVNADFGELSDIDMNIIDITESEN